MPPTRVRRLAAFLDTIEERLGWEFDTEDFGDRLRLQKYVFLAEAFGFDHNFDYGMHVYGPYCPDLAEIYYEHDLHTTSPSPTALTEFDARGFGELVRDKSTEWLEIAGTVKAVHERYASPADDGVLREDVIDKVGHLKDVPEDTITEIYSRLADAGVV
ncbi:MAG: hypothetical protein ABEH77_04085 [Halobacteriaceae archaeon]